jgi:hypothetical protein
LIFRKIEELEKQLELERLKREKLEAELDECRNEILRLVATLRTYEDKIIQSQVRVFLCFDFIGIISFSNDHQVQHMNQNLRKNHQLRVNDKTV